MSETAVNFYQTIRYQTAEEYTLHSHRLQNVNYNGYTTTDISKEGAASIFRAKQLKQQKWKIELVSLP
jgi:hypothetical protein